MTGINRTRLDLGSLAYVTRYKLLGQKDLGPCKGVSGHYYDPTGPVLSVKVTMTMTDTETGSKVPVTPSHLTRYPT